jgi:hypothetical protein
MTKVSNKIPGRVFIKTFNIFSLLYTKIMYKIN